ncbi:MAG TPA: VCBS repeat-containing protein [Candidatus Sumerlaeota bacterium]|nr:VCBS repeat-containing protein [Candidatus Sumerlaeota bacterium]
MKKFFRFTALLALAAATSHQGARAADGVGTAPMLADAKLLPAEARDFSLSPPEIYKVNRRSKDLTVEDMNGDGLLDVLLTTNEKSILEVFYQKKKADDDGNRFDHQTIGVDRMVRSVGAIDVNGDGRNDLLMATSPPKLVVLYQDDKGRLQAPQDTPLEADRLTLGDLDGDGNKDVLVYQQGSFSILKTVGREVKLEATETFYTTGEPASDPMIIDFDGDGRADIVYHDANQFEDLVVRLQSAEKTFPSEFRLHSAVMRTVAPLPRGKGEAAHIISVQNVSRELVELALAEDTEKKSDALVLSDEQTIPFDPETKSAKSVPIVTDFDGDGRKDMIIYSPDLSVLRLLRQTRGGSLVGSTIPSLQGIEDVLPLSAEKGAPTPLVMFSSNEKAIVFAKFDEKTQTIPFPTVLPVTGQPKGVAVLDISGRQFLAAILKVDDNPDLQLRAYPIDRNGKLGEQQSLFPDTPDFKSPLAGLDVIGMEAVDVNRDNRKDLVVYADFKPAVLLLQDEKGKFSALAATSGVLQGLLQGAKPTVIEQVNLTKKTEDTAVLALKEKFARAFHIDKEQNVDVEQQFNGRNSSARLAAVGVGHLKTKDAINVVLLDKGNKELTIYGPSKEANKFEIATSVELDNADYTSLRVFDLDDDGRDDIVVTADDRVGVYYSRPITGRLETICSAKTDVDEGGYGKAYTADIIAGGELEVVALEMKDQLMEIFSRGMNQEKKPALNRFFQFRMFDSETTIARRVNMDALPEPRDLTAADLNDDGLPDIVCLMHDNLIIYNGRKREKPRE